MARVVAVIAEMTALIMAEIFSLSTVFVLRIIVKGGVMKVPQLVVVNRRRGQQGGLHLGVAKALEGSSINDELEKGGNGNSVTVLLGGNLLLGPLVEYRSIKLLSNGNNNRLAR